MTVIIAVIRGNCSGNYRMRTPKAECDGVKGCRNESLQGMRILGTGVLLRGALGGCRKVSQTLRLYLGGLMKAIVRLIRNCELLGILFEVSRILGFKLCTENLALRIFCQRLKEGNKGRISLTVGYQYGATLCAVMSNSKAIVKSEKTLSNEFENIVEAFMEILDNTVTPAVIADVTFNERNQCRL
uniref:Uncharacterized protein n=1 Tax=Vespula pensylvanica TaxID=30213 RepID=A0A834NQI6_VESPE|nr:hypothetical protein H0235_012290 [Vespula pensylvanica]